MQTQRNSPMSSKQVPSLWQGDDAHSLMLISHLSPVIPTGQSHRKYPGVLTHDPPCSHGDTSPTATAISKQAKLICSLRNANSKKFLLNVILAFPRYSDRCLHIMGHNRTAGFHQHDSVNMRILKTDKNFHCRGSVPFKFYVLLGWVLFRFYEYKGSSLVQVLK